MSQSRMFLVMLVLVGIAMTSGIILYKKAFRKEQLFFKVADVKLYTKAEKGSLIFNVDPYIDVLSGKGDVLKKDAAPADELISLDTITDLSFSIADSLEWKPADPKVCFNEMDASTGSKTMKCLGAGEWARKFNREKKSTLLVGEMSRFILQDAQPAKAAMTISFSDGRSFTDTVSVK